MKSIFTIFCVAALANAMTVNRQQQPIPPQQVWQGGQQQARQEQDVVPEIVWPQQVRQGDDNLPSWTELLLNIGEKIFSRQEQGQNCVDVDCEFDWQQQQVRQVGQKQIGQRQDVLPQVPGQQQFQVGQNRQQQRQKCLEMDCESGWLPMRQQQQQVRQVGQKQIGQRQDVQPPMPGQQQFQWGQNREQQKCLMVDCVLEQFPPLPQLHTQDFQNRQQQLIPQQPFGQGGQQQVGQRQIDQIPITSQQQQQRQICNLADCPDDQVHWSAP